MSGDEQMIHYKGFFSYSVVNKLLRELSLLWQSEMLDSPAYRKIQIVMVEMLENNYKYTSEKIDSFGYPEFFPEFKIIKENKAYRLIASNPVSREDLFALKQQLEKINQLDLTALRRWYKEILKEEIYSPKQSPGIGLIRIAKVIRNKFNYSFQKIDNKFLYYTLEILINKK
ncbi:MAG: SiaB family protein kinase [Bacteroidales bacterium]|jgi:hypothetical protein|nr:SiaB family protein kinase [Bacteroidales bacterium]